MRFFVGQTEYKWTHKGQRVEQLWVRREVGEELYKEVETRNWHWALIHSQSQIDHFCRCDIYVDTDNSKYATLFPIKFPHIKPVPKTSQI